MTEIVVVPSERHVERLACEGAGRGETRTALRERLAAALLPDVAFLGPREVRLALGMALAEPRQIRKQLDLFSAAADDPLLAALRSRGGPSWTRAVAALDEAIARSRLRGLDAKAVERSAIRGPAAARAKMIAGAMRALDETLERVPAVDGRRMGILLARAITDVDIETLLAVLGTRSLRSRWILAWDAADIAWWRALDDKLAPQGGGARVVIPTVDRKIEGTRERDELDRLADEVARDLDAAPETEALSGPPEDVAVAFAADAVAQARTVAHVVSEALRQGAVVERVVVACPSFDERTLGPLRRALEDEGIVVYEQRGAPPSKAPVVESALLALELAATLDRVAVARLLRSGYVDATSAAELARALESSATAAGADPVQRLVATAGRHGDAAAQFAEVFSAARTARTRGEHVRAARALFTALGIGARAGRGALSAFASDGPPEGVPRAERLAIARDARAFGALEETLDVYERIAGEVGVLERAMDAEVFRLEIASALDDAAMSRPGAGRATALRLVRVLDLAGEALDLLVVVDANEGVLPRDGGVDALVPEPYARDLAALAAVEAKRVVFVHLGEDAAPSRVVPADARRIEVPSLRPLTGTADVARRASREQAREDFFLDPSRRTSDLTGALVNGLDVLAATTQELPVTGLERFARCPFMGHAHVVLAARDLEPAKELPDAREEGSVLHDVLAAAFSATRELWPRRPRDAKAILARGVAAADEVLARDRGHAKLRGVARLRARDAVRGALEKALLDEEWDFVLAEQGFGPKAEWPPLVVSDLALRGQIDRVDRSHDGAQVRVLDYKRSKSTAKVAMSALGETAIQVPLYAVVAGRVYDVPATGGYVSAQSPDARTATRDSEERMRVLVSGKPSPIEQRALDLVRGVRAGQIAPLPADESECRVCPASGGCRKPRFAMTPDEIGEEPG